LSPSQVALAQASPLRSSATGTVAPPQRSAAARAIAPLAAPSPSSTSAAPADPQDQNVAPPPPPVLPGAIAVQPIMAAAAMPAGVAPPSAAIEPRGSRRDTPTLATIGAAAGVIGIGGDVAPSPAVASGNVGTAAAGSAPGTPAAFGDAIASHVLTMAATGRQEATLQLQPPQLGEMSIRVSVQGRDVSAWFGSAQPQVQQAINDALGQLQLDLAGAGLNLAGAWVGADTSGMQRQYEGTTAATRRLGFAAPAIERASREGADLSQRPSGVNVYV